VIASCYLLGLLDSDGRIVGLLLKSEPPQKMTRGFMHGKPLTEMVTICEASGPSYSDAMNAVRYQYASLFPRLAERLSWPGAR